MAVGRDAQLTTFGTWLRFMLGQSDAIDSVAKSQYALWVGLLFVLSAGLAREYDGEYLAREPWHLLLPLAASLATSFVLYAIVYLAAHCHSVTKLGFWIRSKRRRPIWRCWRSCPCGGCC